MVNEEDDAMVRRYVHLLLTVAIAVALAGLVGCHKKEAEGTGSAARAQGSLAEGGSADEDLDQEEVDAQPAPPPSPVPKGPLTYPEGEGPVLFQDARVSQKEKEPGHWHVVYTVNTPPREVVAFYRSEASRKGWAVKSSQPMPPGAFITWTTPHGELQLIVALSPTGSTSVDLNWNQNQ